MSTHLLYGMHTEPLSKLIKMIALGLRSVTRLKQLQVVQWVA